MATISLYAEKVNAMPGLIEEAGKAFADMSDSLFSLKKAALEISTDVVNMDDVTKEAQEAIDICDSVKESLDNFKRQTEQFIETVVQVDQSVAELIAQRTEEFFKQHEWMRPETEKTWWDKAGDVFEAAFEWCKENWKIIATVAIAVVAIACVCIPGLQVLAPIATLVLKGMLSGAIMGALTGGISTALSGGSFLEGAFNGMIDGAFSGALMAGVGAGVGAAGTALGLCGKLQGLSQAAGTIGKVLDIADKSLDTFDTVSQGLGLIYPDNPITEFNNKLNSSEWYSTARFGITMGSIFFGSMSETLHCFPAGTLVLAAAGLVAIETIKAGDLVMASDGNGNMGLKRVVRTFINPAEAIVRVVFSADETETGKIGASSCNTEAGRAGHDSSKAADTVSCTPGHKFYVEGIGFVRAEDLQSGDILVTSGGKHVTVEAVEADESVTAENPTSVYNFEVEDWHTYFVGEGCVLVHNMCAEVENGATAINSGNSSVDDLLDGLEETTGKKGLTRNFESSGGYEQTLRDFDKLNPSDVKTIPTKYGDGKTGLLSDGTRVVARQGSKTGPPTLEINVSRKKIIKSDISGGKMEKWIAVFPDKIAEGNYETEIKFGEEEGLVINLINHEKRYIIYFGVTSALRILDEGLVQSGIYDDNVMDELKKDNFKSMVYEVKNGEFASRINEASYGYGDAVGLKHYVIITQNYNIDILTQWEPELQGPFLI